MSITLVRSVTIFMYTPQNKNIVKKHFYSTTHLTYFFRKLGLDFSPTN